MNYRKLSLQKLFTKVESGETAGALENITECFDNATAVDAYLTLTGDINAAASLHKAALPKWVADISFAPIKTNVSVYAPVNDGPSFGYYEEDKCASRAWFLAILSALIAQEDE